MENTETVEQYINKQIELAKTNDRLPTPFNTNLISDGYHTFGELYEHRIRLFIALCKMAADWSMELARDRPKVWAFVENESEEWFLMGIGKDKGAQITYHLPARFWSEVCKFAEILKEKPEFDGHTSADVLQRLKQL
jgi:hypothetical protein